MSDSLLRLKLFRVDELSFRFRPEVIRLERDIADLDSHYEVAVDFDWHPKDPSSKEFIVDLFLECTRRPTAEDARFSKVTARASGIFVMRENATSEDTTTLIPYNCLAILHGIVRGMVVSATSACIGGPYMLPVINYWEIVRAKLDELAALPAS